MDEKTFKNILSAKLVDVQENTLYNPDNMPVIDGKKLSGFVQQFSGVIPGKYQQVSVFTTMDGKILGGELVSTDDGHKLDSFSLNQAKQLSGELHVSPAPTPKPARPGKPGWVH